MIGPAYWTDLDVAELGIFLDGRLIDGGAFYPQPFSLEAQAPGAVLATLGHSDITQYRWLGEDVPVNLEPYVVNGLEVLLADSADYRALKAASNRGSTVALWCDIPIVDQWSIAHAATGQSDWKASRALPWDLSGVTHATRPPVVMIDGVEQALVAASPGAGEAVVPESGGYGVVTTPAGIEGEWLQLWYHPVLRVRVGGCRIVSQAHNALLVSLDVAEVREQLFEVAA